LRPRTTCFNVASRSKLIRKMTNKKLLMEHTLHSSRTFFSYRPNIKKIFLEHIEEIKGFNLRPRTTCFNLAFRSKLIRKMIIKKCFNGIYSNRSCESQRPDQNVIFLEHLEEIKSFNLKPRTTCSNLAFRSKLIRKMTNKKLLMKHTLHSSRPFFFYRTNIKKIFLEHIEEIKSFNLRPRTTFSKLAFS
jgi:hypothetical protein